MGLFVGGLVVGLVVVGLVGALVGELKRQVLRAHLPGDVRHGLRAGPADLQGPRGAAVFVKRREGRDVRGNGERILR